MGYLTGYDTVSVYSCCHYFIITGVRELRNVLHGSPHTEIQETKFTGSHRVS